MWPLVWTLQGQSLPLKEWDLPLRLEVGRGWQRPIGQAFISSRLAMLCSNMQAWACSTCSEEGRTHTQRIISVAVSFKKTTCSVAVLVEVKKEEHTPITKKRRSLALTYLENNRQCSSLMWPLVWTLQGQSLPLKEWDLPLRLEVGRG